MNKDNHIKYTIFDRIYFGNIGCTRNSNVKQFVNFFTWNIYQLRKNTHISSPIVLHQN